LRPATARATALARRGAGPRPRPRKRGLWFIAVGTMLIVIAVLLGGHAGGLSTRPVGSPGTQRDRLVYAGTAAGACLVAVGSGIVAVKAFPLLWVAGVSVAGAALAVWLFAAWRLRVDSRNGRDDVRRGPNPPALWSMPGYVEEREWTSSATKDR
jgi:hypothetical protein